MKAVICPVCNGSGKYQVPNSASSAGPVFETCHGCSGKGWVEVNESAPAVITYPVYPTFPTPWPWHPNEPIITYYTACGSKTTSGESPKD